MVSIEIELDGNNTNEFQMTESSWNNIITQLPDDFQYRDGNIIYIVTDSIDEYKKLEEIINKQINIENF